jgi:SAM-dependent methyltransferase
MDHHEAYKYALRVDTWSRKEEWLLDATALLEACGHRRGDVYLDYGTNTGTMLELMYRRGLKAFGFDTNQEALSLARRRLQSLNEEIHLLCDVRMITERTEAVFDGIVLSHVLGHLDHPEDTLEFLSRKLRSGGVFAIVLPNPVYDKLMVPWNALSGYKSDPTLKHEIGLEWIDKNKPDCVFIDNVFYRGETPKYLPRFMPERLRSRLMVILRKKTS